MKLYITVVRAEHTSHVLSCVLSKEESAKTVENFKAFLFRDKKDKTSVWSIFPEDYTLWVYCIDFDGDEIEEVLCFPLTDFVKAE